MLFIDQADNFFEGVQGSVKTQFEIELDGFPARGTGIFLLLTSQSVPQVVFVISEEDDDGGGVSNVSVERFSGGDASVSMSLSSKPDFRQSAELLRGFLTDHPHEEGIACDDLVHLLSSPSASDIKYAVAEARQLAQREIDQGGQRTRLKRGLAERPSRSAI